MKPPASLTVSQQCTACGTKLQAGVVACSFCTCPYLKVIAPEQLPLTQYLKP